MPGCTGSVARRKWPAAQTALAHTRSDVDVGGCWAYSVVTLHCLSGAHSRSATEVGARLSNSAPRIHAVVFLHARSEEAVAAVDWKVRGGAQDVSVWHVLACVPLSLVVYSVVLLQVMVDVLVVLAVLVVVDVLEVVTTTRHTLSDTPVPLLL